MATFVVPDGPSENEKHRRALLVAARNNLVSILKTPTPQDAFEIEVNKIVASVEKLLGY